jgi:hypothetical protein
MSARGKFMTASAVLGVCVLWIGLALAQETRPADGGPGGPGGSGGPGGRWVMDANMARMWSDPNYVRKMFSDRSRQTIGATEEEWTVIEPKFEKVQRLSMELRGGGMMFMGGFGGGEESETMKASRALGKALQDKDATPADIKAAMQALRDARAKTKTALEEAQKDLRSVLSIRQEAALVQMGLLD